MVKPKREHLGNQRTTVPLCPSGFDSEENLYMETISIWGDVTDP